MSDRFGFDAPKSQPIEDSIVWAAGNGFRYIDFQADVPPNAIASFDRGRVRTVRELCERHGVALGIHPSSAINNAEYVPIMAQAASEYLAANLDLAERLGCGWIIGHGGYHFGDLELRRAAAIERLRRLVDRAEQKGLTVFFENHNREPEHAEMHYLPHNVEETRWFFDAIRSPHFKWAFNVGAHELATTAAAPVSGSIVVSHLVSMRAATAASASRQPCNATSPGLGMCPAAPAVARATDPYPGIRSLRRLARPAECPRHHLRVSPLPNILSRSSTTVHRESLSGCGRRRPGSARMLYSLASAGCRSAWRAPTGPATCGAPTVRRNCATC